MVRGQMFQVEGLGMGGFFLLHSGQPVPGEGASLEQVSAVGRLLYLGQAQPTHEGTYTCECSNVAGNSSQDQQLEVHGEPGWGDRTRQEGPEGGRAGTLAEQSPPPGSGPGRSSGDGPTSKGPLRLGAFY